MSDAKVSVSTVLGGLGVVSLAGLGYYLIRSQTSTSKPHSNKSNNKSNKSKSTSSKAGQHQKDNEDETSSSPGLKPKSVHRGFSVVASERSDGLPRSRAASREDAADPSAAVRRLQEENLRLRRLVTLSDVVEVDPEEKVCFFFGFLFFGINSVGGELRHKRWHMCAQTNKPKKIPVFRKLLHPRMCL